MARKKKGSDNANYSRTFKSSQSASKKRDHNNSLRDRIVARKKKGSDTKNSFGNSNKRKRGGLLSNGMKQSKRFRST